MKQLILDYLRRWARALAVGVLAELLIGWFGGHLGDDPYRLAALQGELGLFLGAFLLNFDLQHGMARMAATLPLTARQTGRAWWQAAVAIPAIGFSAAQFLGAGGYWLGHRATSFNWVALGVADVYLFLMLGSVFPLAFLMGQGGAVTGWRAYLGGAAGAAWGLVMVGSMFNVTAAAQHSTMVICFVVVAAGLTVAGWHWAEQLVLLRTGWRSGTGVVKRRTEIGRTPRGFGGIPRFIGATFLRAFLIGAAMMVVMALVFWLLGSESGDAWDMLRIFPMMGMFPFMYVVFFALMPALQQLRILRSLPVTATGLAGMLLASLILPLAGLQLLMAMLGWLVSGQGAAVAVANSFLLSLPFMMLCLVVIAWQGQGIGSFLLMILFMILAQFIPSILNASDGFHVFSLGVCGVTSGFFLALSFWLLRRSLLRSSRPYRGYPGLAGTAWGVR
jgi:hypothetical protein